MLKFCGNNYNLDFLLQFQVLKQLLEALAKKQLEYDSILYGANIDHHSDNQNNNNNNINNNNYNNNNYNNIENNYEKNNNKNEENNRKNSDFSTDDIGEIIDLFGLKNGIKKNNDLILTLNKRFEKIEKKASVLTPEYVKELVKTEIVKSVDYINNKNKEKFNDIEEKIKELNIKTDTINSNTENYLDLIEKNKKDLMNLIYKNKNEIQKNKESIEKMKKTLNDYINSKINQMKYNLDEEINKQFEMYNDNFNKNIEKNVTIINEKIEKINKLFKDQETKIFSIEERHQKTTENINENINSLFTFKSDQKSSNSKFRSEMTNLKLMYENYNNKIHQINDLLESNTFQSLLSDLNNISSKIVDVDEYKKTIDLINNHLKDLQSDNNQYRRYFNDIIPLIQKISTTEDLKKLEELLKQLLEEQNSAAQKKYADKSEIQKNIKKITSQIKILMDKYNKDKEKGESCILASKPISEFRCASCENIITDLKSSTQYLPWNKFPMQDMAIKPYRIGNGFSHFLQNINLERSSKNIFNKSDGENSDNCKKNNMNFNNLSNDKINNKSNLPMVNNNLGKNNNKSQTNIVEIKAHFKTEDNVNLSNNYINTYFTKTVYSDNNFFGNLSTKRNNKKNNYPSFNNTTGNLKATFNDKIEKKNKIKYLNIQEINNSGKDSVDSPIKNSRKNKKDNYKLIYDNLK